MKKFIWLLALTAVLWVLVYNRHYVYNCDRLYPFCNVIYDEGPNVNTGNRLIIKLGQSRSTIGLQLTPVEIVEDSRCPAGTQCIWAGTVKVRVDFATPTGHGSQIFELGKTTDLSKWQATLIQVEPVPQAGVEKIDADYTFSFEVEKVGQ